MRHNLVTADILRLCSIERQPRVFTLPTSERPSRILSQQRRALNIVHSLLDNGILGSNGLAIIGAGFGGLTAAAYAALQGVKVFVFESGSNILGRFRESKRFIHPRMYDWPQVGWDVPTADLPVMNWTANEAHRVVKELEKQFSVVRNQFHTELWRDTTITSESLQGTDTGVYIRWMDDRNSRREKFDAALIAVGFGHENRPVGEQNAFFQQYWDINVPRRSDRDFSKTEVHCVGNGDGALADLIGLAALLGAPMGEKVDRQQVYLGNFVPLLQRLERIREQIYELELSESQRMLAISATEASSDYLKAVKKLLKGNKLPKLRLGSLKIYGRSKPMIEVTKTYAANRWLFDGIFGDIATKGGSSYELKPDQESDATWFGPFVLAKPDTCMLQRPGPSNPFARDFAGMVSPTDKSDLRPLALTERPISPAWSHRAQWEPVKLQKDRLRLGNRDCRLNVQRQHRLVLATEWADTPIQKLLCSGKGPQTRAKARSLIAGLLRLYVLLFDEVALTDATIIDGQLIMPALEQLSASEIATVSVHCRAKTMQASAVAFLTKKLPRQPRRFSAMQLSSTDERPWQGLPKDQLVFEGNTSEEILDTLVGRFSCLSQLRERVDKAQRMFGNRLRVVGGGAQLKTVMPLSGVLEHLSDGNIHVNGCLPARDSMYCGPRTKVFNHLKDISGADDPFESDDPEWLPMLASWYNTAYNSAIAEKNGATAYDVLWVNPISQVVEQKSGPVTRIRLHELASIRSGTWDKARQQAAGDVSAWRRGEISLHDALASLKCCDQPRSSSKIRAGTLKQRMETMLDAESIQVREFINQVPEPYSPSRLVVFEAKGFIVSAILFTS